MPLDDYAAAPSSGKLKLKGVAGSKVEKKKKKKSKDKDKGKNKEPDQEREVERGESGTPAAADEAELVVADEQDAGPEGVGRIKTAAEIRHEEMKRKRVCLIL